MQINCRNTYYPHMSIKNKYGVTPLETKKKMYKKIEQNLRKVSINLFAVMMPRFNLLL